MEKVLAFLRECGVFYLGTTDGQLPKMRPFGFVMNYKGRLSFSTNTAKSVYRQLRENPRFSVCAFHDEQGRWLRLDGRAEFLDVADSMDATEQYKAIRADIVYAEGDVIFQLHDGVCEWHEADNSYRTETLEA